MYLHIGGDFVLSTQYIIGIFEFESAIDQTEDTMLFIKWAETNERVEIISPDIPRSYIVTVDRIYLSPISVVTLRKRLLQGIE